MSDSDQGAVGDVIERMIAEKRATIERLSIEIATLEAARRRMSGEPEPRRALEPRGDLKAMVLNYLVEVGASGLNAGIIVQMAEKRGRHVNRQSVSSLLSRLKSEGTVTYFQDRYRLPADQCIPVFQDRKEHD